MTLMPLSDAVFLVPERREQPMHVGSLQVYELPAGAGADWVAALHARWLTSTEVRPLLRRRPARSLRTLGSWSWVLDDDVDLDHHVRLSALPRQGRVRELLALVSRLHGTPIDRRRPLWELHLVEGLDGGRFAVYTKIHHALLDGVAGMRLLGEALAASPDETVPPMWAPRPAPPLAGGGGTADIPGRVLRIAADLAGIGPAVGRLAARRALDPLCPEPVAPRTVLNVPITGSRRFAAQDWALQRVRRVAEASGGTVNDVVLAMSGAALRTYLLELGALPDDPLVALTPVSLGDRQAAGDGGNSVGAILCSLATDVADPGLRLARIHESMSLAKEAMAGLSPLQAIAVSALQVAPLAASALWSLAGVLPQAFNVIVSNVPGPREALYLDGARLVGLYPLSVPLHGQALNVTCTSYDGRLGFGLTGDRRALPHLQRLLGHLQSGLEDLEVAVGA